MLASVFTCWLGVPSHSQSLGSYKKVATLAAPATFYDDPNPTGLMAGTECPTAQLKGALFNHISKTGGTTFKQLLLTTLVLSSNSSARHEVFGDPETALRQKLVGTGHRQWAHSLHCRPATGYSEAERAWRRAGSASQPHRSPRSPPGRLHEPCGAHSIWTVEDSGGQCAHCVCSGWRGTRRATRRST